MATAHAEELIDFVAGISISKLPAEVVSQATTCLLDALGCGLFGATQPWSEILAEEMAQEHGGGGASTVFGQLRKLPAPAAALCNGTAVHGFELDDLIAASVVHPAAAVVPAALAAGEACGASGARLIEAIVAGYEVMHRIGLALGVEPAKRGFHTTSLAAPAAAAVAAGMALGLDRAQLYSAVGLACSAASGIKSFADGDGGGMVKRLHLGRAAEAGVRMSQLARRGFSGPPRAIDSRFGLIHVFGGAGARPERLVAGLGERWAVGEVWFKVFPICGWIQGVVQILGEIRGVAPLTVDDIREVRVGVSEYAARNNGEPAPIDTMGAQYSIPYCAAAALAGDPRDPALFAQSMVDDAKMRALAGKVEVYAEPEVEAVYPAKFGAAVSLTLAGGEARAKMVLECHGTSADPCSPREHREKFKILSKHQLTDASADDLIGLAHSLAELPSIAELTAALVPSVGAATRPGGAE
jgi:2-methylcitrate dehydratase PrpD